MSQYELSGIPIDAADLLFVIKRAGQQPLLDDLVRLMLVEQETDRLGLTVSIHEVQEAAEKFRTRNNLVMAEDIKRRLRRDRVSTVEFERLLCVDLLKDKLRDHVADEKAIGEYFSQHTGEFDRAEITFMTSEDANLLNRIKAEYEDGNDGFDIVARRHAMFKRDVKNLGVKRLCFREDLPAVIETVVFAAKADHLAGPISDGNTHHLIFVHRLLKAELDQDARTTIADIMLEKYLNGKLQNGKQS